MELSGKRILVVGGNGAFGAEFGAQLKTAGASVIGTARSQDSSVRLATDLDERLLLDLENDESITRLTNYLTSSPMPLDGIVLAAGLVAFGSIGETPFHVVERLTRVNATAQIQLVSALLSKLQDSASLGRQPFVLSISGVISERPMPSLAAYSASKTAIRGYAQAAVKELKKSGITWLDARPGHTESGLASRSIFGQSPNFGLGLSVSSVVARMVQGLVDEEADLASEAFAALGK
ncbi:MAG: hypothetical protein RL612_191 [Actinomycetota bacterium]|jgi:cyclic-di-GMP-binding biofilm dispersal mediator protein